MRINIEILNIITKYLPLKDKEVMQVEYVNELMRIKYLLNNGTELYFVYNTEIYSHINFVKITDNIFTYSLIQIDELENKLRINEN